MAIMYAANITRVFTKHISLKKIDLLLCGYCLSLGRDRPAIVWISLLWRYRPLIVWILYCGDTDPLLCGCFHCGDTDLLLCEWALSGAGRSSTGPSTWWSGGAPLWSSDRCHEALSSQSYSAAISSSAETSEWKLRQRQKDSITSKIDTFQPLWFLLNDMYKKYFKNPVNYTKWEQLLFRRAGDSSVSQCGCLVPRRVGGRDEELLVLHHTVVAPL